jgi:hypothetical protein
MGKGVPPLDRGRCLLTNTAFLKVDHAHDHSAPRVERQILKAPAAIEGANLVVDRVCDDTEAADFPRCSQCRPQGEKKQRACVPSILMIFVNRKLSKKRNRHWIGLVALLRFGQERALDLRRAQGHVTYDVRRGRVASNIGARDAGGVIGPGMPPEPLVQRLSATIKFVAIVGF